MKRRTRKKAKAVRAPARKPARKPVRKAVRVKPDSAVVATTAAFTRYRMAKMPVQRLVNLHNKIAKRRKKSFDDVAVMNAAKMAALAKGAELKR